MRFYALIISVVLWTAIRFYEKFDGNCAWEDSIFSPMEIDWIFYPLATIELILRSAAIPMIFGCIFYIVFF